MSVRLHHVNLVVPPGMAEETAEFWRGVFGMTDLPRQSLSGRRGAWLSAGDFELHISERDVMAHSDAHVAIAVADVAAVRAACLAVGAVWEDANAMFGEGRGFTRDPGGNRIEVVHDTGGNPL